MKENELNAAAKKTAGSGVRSRTQILYLKRNSLDDGPGIRTTVFLKGCPLDCVWCHNPESKSAKAELSFDPEKCIGCRTCIYACKRKAIDRNNIDYLDRSKCNLCFKCTLECPSQAMTRVGEPMEIAEIKAVIKRDIPFYKTSGGGVTLSGGEPTMHMSFCAELLRECKALGVHTMLETCGQFDLSRFRAEVYPLLDAVYFDIKLIDSESHKKYCGVDNKKILDNFRRLCEAARSGGAPVLPRVPLVPGITDTDANLSLIAAFLRGCGAESVALLPYNPTWLKKPAMLGKKRAYDEPKWMSESEIARCRAHFDGFEIK
ncbi:MAG: glycyl-radical enzyme activating protein [bacterium]